MKNIRSIIYLLIST